MAAGFSSLDQRLSRDVRDLHNYLWDPSWHGSEKVLRANLLKGARALDVFLRAGGRLRKSAEGLAEPWSREHQGASLYELLDDTVGLTAATELVRKKRNREAAARVEAVAESTSIGVCSAAKCFEIVEEWESRKIDFQAYTRRLANVLQSKFMLQADQFRRLLNTVHDFGSNWDGSATPAEQTLAARTAVESTAWCIRRSLAFRTLLGEPQRVAEKDFEAVLDMIVRRL